MSDHPTLVLMHNPRGLRVEYRVDDGELELWWSPRAGESYEARDRDYSNRDDHLCVFRRIALPGLDLAEFAGCDYSAYHSVVRFAHQRLHIAVLPDEAAVMVWLERDGAVALASGRWDEPVRQEPGLLVVRHQDPSDAFEFVAAMGEGSGTMRHQRILAEGRSTYARAELAAGQVLVIGVGLAGEGIGDKAAELARRGAEACLERTEAALSPVLKTGRWSGGASEAMAVLRDETVRSLHSQIDDSGALRASIKAIYYLIWLRDGAFCYGYQAMAGWPHRLAEWCRFVLANPTEIDDPAMPAGRMFGQLVNKRLGKAEEDGIYYAIWSVFTRWTQLGRKGRPDQAELDVLRECLAYVENYIYDAERGLFGSYFADETAMKGSRDQMWDNAVGKPQPHGGAEHEGTPIVRLYDIYTNLLMHAALTMMASMTEGEVAATYEAKAAALWERLAPMFEALGEALPSYGEYLLEDGARVMGEPFGPARSVYVWALSLPIFAPVPGIDGIRQRLLERLMRWPAGHWVNGICSVIASIDPWVYPEDRLIEAIEMIGGQALEPGAVMPMGGAMMEKYDAPQGNLYHDIRPQAFSQSAWLAACSSLGVRRLPWGLAVRPTRYYERLDDYAWQGGTVSVKFAEVEGLPRIVVNGERVAHTLQIPESLLSEGASEVAIEDGGVHPLLLRSTARLETAGGEGGEATYEMAAYGPTELVFAERPDEVAVSGEDGEIEVAREASDGLHFVRFSARGAVAVRVR
ncbi:MAG: hypothetical protein ACOCTI_01925 [Phycisphaeraceae bacterium]